MQDDSHRRGFTLVELAIVLVIIGLIVAGIMLGQTLIRSANLRKLIAQQDSFATAIMAFRSKYQCMPGDCPNATAYWGAWSGGNTVPKVATSNGNGNGTIETGLERALLWQHLANAGLIEGQYSGYNGPYGGGCYGIGTVVPKAEAGSLANNAGWEWVPINTAASCCGNGQDALGYYQTRYYGTMVKLATCRNLPGDSLAGTALAPIDAYQIDLKIDDGKPQKGRVVVDSYPFTCAANDGGGAPYQTGTSIGCVMYFTMPVN